MFEETNEDNLVDLGDAWVRIATITNATMPRPVGAKLINAMKYLDDRIERLLKRMKKED